MQETRLDKAELIYPLFLLPGHKKIQEISSMPGQYAYSVDQLDVILARVAESGVNSLLLFGQTEHKDAEGHSAHSATSVVVKALERIKKINPELTLITDVCLCSYTSHGHCGPLKLLSQQGIVVDNHKALELISKVAVAHAKAGADIVAPSGMMDGMVAAIRAGLDQEDLEHVALLAYAVKYASSFYGPFRAAADSTPAEGDRRGYQMDPANKKEALTEALLDIEEGADLLMVKPALPYLDVLHELTTSVSTPVFAYQVSGEYSMIKAAAMQGWINEQEVVLETLTAIKRAGAQAIITYFALDINC